MGTGKAAVFHKIADACNQGFFDCVQLFDGKVHSGILIKNPDMIHWLL
jgi:hypothetical protein